MMSDLTYRERHEIIDWFHVTDCVFLLTLTELQGFFSEKDLDHRNYIDPRRDRWFMFDTPAKRRRYKSYKYAARIENILYRFMECEGNDAVRDVISELLKYASTYSAFSGLEEKLPPAMHSYIYDILIKGTLVSDEDSPEEDNLSLSVEFDDQQEIIIETLSKAKYMIWVAMYTFTSKAIFDTLLKKQAEGLNVELIVYDYNSNRRSGLKYTDIKGFMWHPPFGNDARSLMHRKTAIIDLKTVIDGSYNYTEAAKGHLENLILLDNRDNACKYADMFIQMKNEIDRINIPF